MSASDERSERFMDKPIIFWLREFHISLFITLTHHKSLLHLYMIPSFLPSHADDNVKETAQPGPQCNHYLLLVREEKHLCRLVVLNVLVIVES